MQISTFYGILSKDGYFSLALFLYPIGLLSSPRWLPRAHSRRQLVFSGLRLWHSATFRLENILQPPLTYCRHYRSSKHKDLVATTVAAITVPMQLIYFFRCVTTPLELVTWTRTPEWHGCLRFLWTHRMIWRQSEYCYGAAQGQIGSVACVHIGHR